MSIDTDFSRHLEEVFPGRDILATTTRSCTITAPPREYGRGSVLTIDLTTAAT